MTQLLRYREIHDCRICGGPVETVLDLGSQPLANSFLASPDEPDPVYPLEVKLCRACIHLQLGVVVDRLGIFKDYIYSSRPNPTLSTHFQRYAEDVLHHVDRPDFVLEIGSNDGLLLQYFAERGVNVLGVDPAANIDSPVPTLRQLWSRRTAVMIGRQADVILANNVLAHIDNLNDAVAGMVEILADDGLIVIELPYAGDLWSKGIYDTVYHEHLSMMGVTALCTLFERHGLYVQEKQEHAVQGTSVRLFIGHDDTSDHKHLKQLERTEGRDSPRLWRRVRAQVEDQKRRVNHRLGKLHAAGKRIVGYGAPAKGNTLLNYTGCGQYLSGLIDDMPSKQGKYAPGSKLPVGPREGAKADAFLLLAWNYEGAIREKERGFGGEWIHPYAA